MVLADDGLKSRRMPIAVMANKVDAQVRRNREGVGGWGEQDPPPPYFGRSVNPTSKKEADYVHHITRGIPRFTLLKNKESKNRINQGYLVVLKGRKIG